MWVEIIIRISNRKPIITSLPLRECGLKCLPPAHLLHSSASLPLRECGLKSVVAQVIIVVAVTVTPLAGVWVEIGTDAGT